MQTTVRIYAALLVIVCLTLAGGLASAGGGPIKEDGTMQIKVMSFNIWLGGTQVNFDKVIEAIKASEADIIGIQEPRQSLPVLAEALGYYYDVGQKLLSRYPLIAPPAGSLHYVFAQVAPGKAIAVSNVHLRAFPYTPYLLRDGDTVQNALVAEQYHVLEITPTLRALRSLAAADIPVFLTGDFNVPSHLDWTEAAAAAADEPFRTKVPWPVSVRLAEYGFRDTFREMHPDPVTRPGITWSPGYPVPHVDADDVLDRIDFVYAAGPSVTTASQIVGEGGPHTDIIVTPWPSDHRAVVSTFTAVPAPMPADDAPRARITPATQTIQTGEAVHVQFSNGTGHRDAWIGIYPKGTPPGPNGWQQSLRWNYITGTEGELLLDEKHGNGATWPLPPGAYDVHLFADSSYHIIASAEFVVQ